jgi:hypothetical protein
MVPLLNHSTAHPPTTPLHWPLAVPNAYMAWQMWMWVYHSWGCGRNYWSRSL